MPSLLNELETCRSFVPYEVVDDVDIAENAAKLKKMHADSADLSADEYIDVCTTLQSSTFHSFHLI